MFGSKKLFQEINIATVQELHEISTIKHVKKLNLLTSTQQNEDRTTRNNKTTITLPKVHTNIGKANCIYRGLQNFNRLDQQDREKIIKANNKEYKKIIRTITENNRKI